MGKAIQLRGTPVIMKAFDRIAIANWALLYDGKILFKSAGDTLEDSKALLEGFLKQLELSRTTALYELRFYDDIKDKKKIKVGVEADYAYNLELFDQEEYPVPGSLARREGYAMLNQRLDDIQAQLAVRKQEEEEEEEDAVGTVPGWMSAVNKLLDNPKIQEQIGARVMGWLDQLITPANTIPMQPQREMGAIGSTGTPAELPKVTEDQALKIQKSIEILAGIDPQLGDNLERIAQLASANPKKYRSLITMLNIMS